MKIQFKYIFLLSMALLFGTSCKENIQSGNLVKNPSFEAINDKGAIEGWKTSSWIKTPEARQFTASEQAFLENVSAQIINFQENHSAYTQIINVKERSN